MKKSMGIENKVLVRDARPALPKEPDVPERMANYMAQPANSYRLEQSSNWRRRGIAGSSRFFR